MAVTFAAMIIVLWPRTASGRPQIRQDFFAAYPSAVGSILDAIGDGAEHCGACHYNFEGGGTRNPYGRAVRDALSAYPNTPAGRVDAIRSTETGDPDQDGYDTLTEITDVATFENTPTFPGLAGTDEMEVRNVSWARIYEHLVPTAGGDSLPPIVGVITPNGGEILTANAATTIEWTATDSSGVASVDLYLSLDDGETYDVIATGLTNSGTYTWVPANRPTAQGLVRVEATDNALNIGADASDRTFVVFPPFTESPVPTTLRDFDLPGTQPLEGGPPIAAPSDCGVCHGGYDWAVEPLANWRGSMMALASRDPLFKANLVIANQEVPESGDICLRCHLPRGWLRGRSVPTDGSRMLEADATGVSCDLCHRMVDPIFDVNNPPVDADILAGLTDPASTFGTAMYVIDPNGSRRGPFVDADSGHSVVVSPFHREAAFCGTCHDVSNPVFEKNEQGDYTAGPFDTAAADSSSEALAPIERTYSEWYYSQYNSPNGVYAPQFGGNKEYVATCQDCHMRDVTGYGCDPAGFADAPLRTDLPLHDMTGGSTWVPGLVGQLYPEDVNQTAVEAGISRAKEMLGKAAELEYLIDTGKLVVTVTNQTGHKLPTGYPEGRRMWLNVRFYDSTGVLLSESGAYDPNTGVLTEDAEAKVYEVKPGLDSEAASLANKPAGPSFHFVLNNKVFKDNRIPPRGFDNAAFAKFGGAPVEYEYADGQYWDRTWYSIPAEARSANVTLYYQSTSKEFVEFLRDENRTDDSGQQMYDLWHDNGKCPPERMESAATPRNDLDGVNGVDFVDFALFAENWNRDCGDQPCRANLDASDNIVDWRDLAVLQAGWLWGQ